MPDNKRPPIVIWLIPIMVGVGGFFPGDSKPELRDVSPCGYRSASRLRRVHRCGHGGDNSHDPDATVTLE
jgi:hypothetical protein